VTLLARNNIFKGGIILAALSLSLLALGGYFSFQAFPEAGASATLRPGGIIQKIIEHFFEPSAYIPLLTMLCAVVYSLVSIFLIYYFFEKTNSPEIIFIGFFAISMAFEAARVVIPLGATFSFPAIYLDAASRILLFGRYFGLFSLFAASVYAAGLDAQKQQNFFLMLVMATIIIALNIPVDSLVWDSTFLLWSGYGTMFFVVETGILAVTVLTFMVSAYTRSSRHYIFIGIGAFLIYAGRNILIHSDTWITPIPGLALLVAGTWLICSRLHQEYLWL
jgi:hypothetical protein